MTHSRTMVDADIKSTHTVTAVEEAAVHKTMGIDVEDTAVEPTVISHITVGHTECVPIPTKTTNPQHINTKSTRCGVTRCWEVKETAPYRSFL